MPFRTQNFRCPAHGVFEDLISVPSQDDREAFEAAIASRACKTCGAESPRTYGAPLMAPKFIQFKDDTKNRARK